MIILDTNILSELMRPQPSPRVTAWIDQQADTEIFTTTITQAEIFYGLELKAPGKRRDQLLAAAEAMFTEDLAARVLAFDSLAARAFSRIAAHRRGMGKPIAHADAQIAAISQTRGARLATRNIADFADCGVDLINPWSLP